MHSMQALSSSAITSSSTTSARAIAGTLLRPAPPFQRSVLGYSGQQNTQALLVKAVQLADNSPVAASDPPDTVGHPKLLPISRTLARDMQQTQRLKQQLQQEISTLESQIWLASSQSPGTRQQLLSMTSSNTAGLVELSEDPLFCISTSPSFEQLQRRLVKLRSQLKVANSGSLADVLTVMAKLQDLAECLGLPLDMVVPMVAHYEPLLLQQPHELPARLQLLSAALQLPPDQAAALLATTAPQLLATPLRKLQSNLGQLARVLSSRGLKPAELLQERPDLLCQSPASLALKLEELPGALGMSRQLVRQLISRCPQLLRRSVSSIQHRYRSLCQLFKLPGSFVQEFLVQEPELLCLSADLLKAKFDSLVQRYGAFSDDVVDLVLVDPSMLLEADPDLTPPAPTVKASRKKQLRLLQQQQALAESATSAQSDNGESAGSTSSGPDTASLTHGSSSSESSSWEEGAFRDATDAVFKPEPWEILLQQRQQQRRAMRRQQRQRKQQHKQQLQHQGLEQAVPQLLDMQSLEVAVAMQQQQYLSGKLSPVRQLLHFAAATGLSISQALMLWQQEPALAQLPTAVVAAQVSRLSNALGFETADASTLLQFQQKASASSAATESTSSTVSTAARSSSGSIEVLGSPASNIRPVLQVLVKEPRLLILTPSQAQTNIQGLCDQLMLAAQHQLLPLLWEYPGMLMLAPEVVEYRLQHLAGLLQLSVPRALSLILQQPQLLVERPVLLAARLGSLCTLLGVSRSLASECVLREPLLLCVDDDVLQGHWLQLCNRVGWADDAVDLVLADPSALMRGDVGWFVCCVLSAVSIEVVN